MDDVNSLIGSRIRDMRKSLNLNQAELGAKIGYTHVAISEWETGKKPVSMSVLIKLADLFKVDLSYFVTELTMRQPSKKNEGEEHPDKWEEIAESLAKALILREENEKRRIELVDAVEAQARLKHEEAQADRAKTDKLAYEELRQLLLQVKETVSHGPGRTDEAATGEGRSLVNG